MIARGEFFEAVLSGKNLVICDVQPGYANNIYFMDEWAKFLEGYQNILVLFVGPEFGLDNKAKIARWYFDYGVPKEKLYSMKWHEKNYAFFRDMMDSGCWAREEIIRVVKYLLYKKIYDWRQLTEEDIRIINKGMDEKLMMSTLENYFMGIPDLAFKFKKWAGSDICGGGFYECLDEVMILAEAMRLNLNIVQQFTYGG